jgi:hypothetical protein
VATEGGLNLLQGDLISTFTGEDGLSNQWIWSLAQNDEGTLWIGADVGLTYHRDEQIPPLLDWQTPLLKGVIPCSGGCQQQPLPYNTEWVQFSYAGSDLGDLHGLQYLITVDTATGASIPVERAVAITTATSFRQDMVPGATISVSVVALDKHFNQATTPAPQAVLSVLTPTLWQRFRDHPLSLPGAVAVLMGVIVYGISFPVRQALRVQAGYRWHFAVAQQCDYIVKVDEEPQGIRLSVESAQSTSLIPGAFIALPHDGPPDLSQMQTLRSALHEGSTVRVVVPEDLFSWPLAHELGSSWSTGAKAIIAGQQMYSQEKSEQRTAHFPSKLACAALYCAKPVERPPLISAKEEAEEAARCFSQWRADVTALDRDARVNDLQQALANCDIVHVSAHATAEGIFLADRFMTVADLGTDLLKTIRCRLLVLSACEAGKWESDHAFVLRLVQWGVNVVAAVRAVNDIWVFRFFGEFYKAFLPSERNQSEGSVFAAAIRATGPKLAQIADEQAKTFGREASQYRWQTTVDSFMLYGDPSLRLSFRR